MKPQRWATYRDARGDVWRYIRNRGFDWLDTSSGRTCNVHGPASPVVMVLTPQGDPVTSPQEPIDLRVWDRARFSVNTKRGGE